ncbi:MAG: UvrD-helicase domain-containing protein [Proteobacteria bacterium]|nr:UvrD-helicase domain-containing protein [Pseudomonadota bacterium]
MASDELSSAPRNAATSVIGERRLAPGFWARVLGVARNDGAVLTASTLTVAGANGTLSLSPGECLGDVRRRSVLLWDTLILDAPTGPIRIRGLSCADARDWEGALNKWLEPARLASLEPLRARLQDGARRSEATWSGDRFVRASEQQRTVQLIENALAQLSGSRWDTWCSDADRSLELGLRAALREAGLRRLAANDSFSQRSTTAFGNLFDSIESNPLTDAQRRACVMADDNNLVLAGAGTGKTSVVLGRIAYLLTSGIARPEQILALAYNVDAAAELRERVRMRVPERGAADDVTVQTFHAFGMSVIGAVDGRKPSISKLAADPISRDSFVTTTLEELLRRPGYLRDFLEYGFHQLEPCVSAFDFPTLEAYERDLGGRDLRTLSGDRVKSAEELRIANWLTLNGVPFTYEAPYPIDTADAQHRAYQPDFTIERPDDPRGALFLEHFGIDEHGSPPPFFPPAEAERYKASMDWKRALHTTQQTDLIETYSYEFRRGTIFTDLEARLLGAGVALNPGSPEGCLEMLRGSHVVTQTGSYFSELLPLCREVGTRAEVAHRLSEVLEQDHYRCQLLWRLLEPIVTKYEEALAEAGDIDFSDLLHRATQYVVDGRFRSTFSQILVDEFQDISEPRARLVMALRDQVPDASLFCVGDDWQSIYRFAGADVSFTSRFAERFGEGSTVALDRTFRFNNQIGDVASSFIGRNPSQTQKAIAAVWTVAAPAVSLVSASLVPQTLKVILDRIGAVGRQQRTRYSVRILARYWHELEGLTEPAAAAGNENDLDIVLSTVHGAKGLEADYVVVVGLERGRSGFPAEKPTDPFRETFLPIAEPFEFAEERRLFYVALTRARHRVYLLYDLYNCSSFVRELKEGGYAVVTDEFRGHPQAHDNRAVLPCPRCATGQLRVRDGKHGRFVSCGRYPICTYRERGCGECGGLLTRIGDFRVCADTNCSGVHPACPSCGSPMQLRRGPSGSFYGCGNYGSLDFELHCSATAPARAVPSAPELRGRRIGNREP